MKNGEAFTPPREQRGDVVIIFALMLALCVFVGFVIGKFTNEGGWTEDCTKLKSHVTVRGKVFKCDPQ